MDFGSILTNSASGSTRRRPIETAPRTVKSSFGNPEASDANRISDVKYIPSNLVPQDLKDKLTGTGIRNEQKDGVSTSISVTTSNPNNKKGGLSI